MAEEGAPGAPRARATGIARLAELVRGLPAYERIAAERLFALVEEVGELVPPPDMRPWIERTFGSMEATLRQHIVRVTNRYTFEGAIFNPLRAHRPGSGVSTTQGELPPELLARIEASAGDDFCDPEHRTPADIFGRVRGEHVITASNVAKADGWHGLAIFDRHNPLAIDAALVRDLLTVAGEWAARAHAVDADARHLFLLWNCLPRAGASLTHGHAQMLLSRAMPQAHVARWHAAATRYAVETGGRYFADLAAVHAALGLGGPPTGDVFSFASLTPVKEREVVLLAPPYTASGPLNLAALAGPLAATVASMRRQGVLAFNLAIFAPPLDGAGDPLWEGFPLVARFVDRGNPLSPTSDIAALELFGSSLVAADPFDVARTLRGE